MRNDRPVRRPTDELLRFAQNLVNLLVRQAARDVNVQKARRAASRKGARPHDNPMPSTGTYGDKTSATAPITDRRSRSTLVASHARSTNA